MFVWSTGSILQEINTCMPDLGDILNRLGDCTFRREEEWESFKSAESVSIDYGVMEKSKKVVMVPCDPGWNDVGDWKAVAEILDSQRGNGDSIDPAIRFASSGCFVHSETGKQVVLVGTEDLIIVEVEDSLLVCSKNHTQDVGEIVKKLKDEKPGLT